ncbi:hypothetical protein HDU76_012826, partial [Blyttiomyces sp. JEL0837]
MKGPPWYPVVDHWDKQYSFNIDDVAFIADLNINVVRLGVMWPGVEPERGKYDKSYLEVIKSIVEMCNEKGIYVILEMHQDSFSERFCGEGVPLWAVDITSPLDRVGIHLPNSTVGFPRPAKEPYELDEKGIPSAEDCAKMSWSSYQLTIAAANAYQNLYDNIDGLLDSFANYWQQVALTFASYPNILGYEIMNEPFAGQIFEVPSLLLPGVADRVNIQRMNSAVGDAIREVDHRNLIFYSGVTWDNFFTGFTDVPGGYGWRDRTVLSFHYYKYKDGGPNVAPITNCFKDRRKDSKRLGSGMAMTEFFVPWEEFYKAIELADELAISWMTWEYKPFLPITGVGNSFFDQETGQIVPNSVELYSRSYVSAVQGTLVPHTFYFNASSFDLSFAFWADPGVGGDTEIRIQTA